MPEQHAQNLRGTGRLDNRAFGELEKAEQMAFVKFVEKFNYHTFYFWFIKRKSSRYSEETASREVQKALKMPIPSDETARSYVQTFIPPPHVAEFYARNFHARRAFPRYWKNTSEQAAEAGKSRVRDEELNEYKEKFEGIKTTNSSLLDNVRKIQSDWEKSEKNLQQLTVRNTELETEHAQLVVTNCALADELLKSEQELIQCHVIPTNDVQESQSQEHQTNE